MTGSSLIGEGGEAVRTTTDLSSSLERVEEELAEPFGTRTEDDGMVPVSLVRCDDLRLLVSAVRGGGQEHSSLPPPPMPTGWRLVPEEPTEAMAQAAGEQIVQQYCDNRQWDAAKDAVEGIDGNEIYRAMLSAAPASVPVEQGWRPIETAPKDGTIIDVWAYWPEHNRWRRKANAFWNGCDWQLGTFAAGQFAFSPAITHWMPLPAAPPPQALCLGGRPGEAESRSDLNPPPTPDAEGT